MNEQTLNLKDIHLPEPISWWPLAPGWWILFFCLLLLGVALFIGRKIHIKKQLSRDIQTELNTIKQQFQTTQNKPQLARSLSALLRRANISYYPHANIAGLTGEQWLEHLDNTNKKVNANLAFNSETGKILLSAPYLPENKHLDFDAQTLISLCESWLLSAHNKTQVSRT